MDAGAPVLSLLFYFTRRFPSCGFWFWFSCDGLLTSVCLWFFKSTGFNLALLNCILAPTLILSKHCALHDCFSSGIRARDISSFNGRRRCRHFLCIYLHVLFWDQMTHSWSLFILSPLLVSKTISFSHFPNRLASGQHVNYPRYLSSPHESICRCFGGTSRTPLLIFCARRMDNLRLSIFPKRMKDIAFHNCVDGLILFDSPCGFGDFSILVQSFSRIYQTKPSSS